ncbi:ABC transporter ATP-binding protein [Quadrisphaera sp. KR29]|uniref:ABC transporter ATP-binding protein n=1 Tax=Quadrisphaera sp. KR29 TaxID=3461391 RepID=UPI004044E8C3
MTTTSPRPPSSTGASSGTPGGGPTDRGDRTDRAVGVRLEGLQRRFGDVAALDGLDLELEPGELVALLGPSGCGKTTALRVLAGLERADAGRVLVGGRDLARVPAHRRDMGVVFQAYSLLPHLDALDNVAFGLRLRGVGTAERRRRAMEALELVGLSAQAHRFAPQMSGGQQQRVALARALAVEPQVLLLDEPFSALDAKVREQLREEVRRIQTQVGTTTLLVTHDQEEALSVADRVGVVRAGRLEQLASPQELYRRPATAFVAEFVGQVNRVPCRVVGSGQDARAQVLGALLPLLPGSASDGTTALLRPEDVSLELAGAAPAPGLPAGLPGTVVEVVFLGAASRAAVRLDGGGDPVLVHLTGRSAAADVGARVLVRTAEVPVLVR